MTTELEEKFYKTFGIEKREYKGCGWNGYCPYHSQNCDTDCAYWETYKTEYPPITDHILLELICILSRLHYTLGSSKCLNSLKEKTLLDCIEFSKFSDYIKSDVRKLFEVE